MHQRRVAFAPHRLDHAERGQRIDEAGRAFGRASYPAAGAGTAPPARSGTANTSRQPGRRPSCRGAACAAAEVPAATTTPAPSLPTGIDWSTRPAMAFMSPAGMLAVTTGLPGRTGLPRGAHVRRPEQQAEVGRIDRRRLDADQDLVGTGLWDRDARQRELQFAAALHEGPKLQRRTRCIGSHAHDLLPDRSLVAPPMSGGSGHPALAGNCRQAPAPESVITMMKLKSKVTLPAVGLSGFETPLSDEETAVQAGVHRFARDVMRPLGARARQDDGRGSDRAGLALLEPVRGVREARARSGHARSNCRPTSPIRMESLIGEELGWGDAGLARQPGRRRLPDADGRGHGQPGTRRPLHGQDRLLDDHAPRQGQRRDDGRRHARVARRPAGQQGQHVGPRPGRRDRHQRAMLGLGVERRRRAGRARLHQRRIRRRLLRAGRQPLRHGRDHSARPARSLEGQAAGQDRPACAAAGRDLFRQRARPEALRRRAQGRVLRQHDLGVVLCRHAHGAGVHRRRARRLRDGAAVLPRAQAGRQAS